MDDVQLIAALQYDEQFSVIRELSAPADSGARSVAACKTELVMRGEAGPFVRKRIPIQLANRDAWQRLATISHPLLPHVEAVYELPDQLVVVTEFVVGQSLAQVVSQSGRFLPDRCEQILSDLCSAASALHEHGIVHRDITPGNVIISPTGAHLIDLGIARIHEEGASHDTTTLGTWGFAAPEQFGFAQTDARSDVYSMGRILGYMLTGLLPSDPAYEQALRNSSVVPVRLAAVVGKACAFEPSARYQSAAELGQAIRAAVYERGGASPIGTPGISAGVTTSRPATSSFSGAQASPGAASGTMVDTGKLVDFSDLFSLRDFRVLFEVFFSSGDLAKILPAVAVLMGLLFSVFLFVVVSVSMIKDASSPTERFSAITGLIIFAEIIVIGSIFQLRDLMMVILRAGRFERDLHPWKSYFKRLLMYAYAMMIIVIVSFFLLVTVGVVAVGGTS